MPRMPGRLALALTFTFGVAGAVIRAQPPAQPHPGEYAPADIAYGSRLYDAQCTTCHGANGDGVGGVDLRSGKFRNAVTDQDLTRVITNGIPGTGMLAFKFDASEIAGVIAYLRNMNAFDPGSAKPGDPSRGRALFEGTRRLPPVPSRRRERIAGGAQPERHRRDSERGLTSAVARRSQRADDADQPARARRDAGRPRHQRPPAERGHLHGADHRRPGAARLADEGGPSRDTRS